MVVFGDFNGDGAPDLAIPGRGDVAILLGGGDGSFGDAHFYTFGEGTGYAAVGDLDGNGDLDLAIAEGSAAATSILLGAGDGSFGDPTVLDAGVQPTSAVTADLDNDGNLDLAVVNLFSSDVSIFLGNGDGSFGDAVSFAAGSFPTSVTAADFDSDGLIDLAISSLGFGSGSAVRLLRNLGAGFFQTTTSLTVGGQPQQITSGDLNGDGFTDIVTANQTTEDLSVLLGNGDGTFNPTVGYSAGFSLLGVALADLDLDGNLDALAINSDSNGQLFTFINDGDGVFGNMTTFSVASRPQSVAAADVDGDGDPDVVVVGQTEVALLINLAVTEGTTVPARPDLVAGSDSGSLSSDDVTRFNNGAGQPLTFTVSGVTSGATIKLFADGIQIGEAAAAGTSVTIVTDGTTLLADGDHVITATSTVDSEESDPSDALTVTIDSTAPLFTSSAITTATLGEQYSYNAQTDEEGANGFIYTLLTAPDGMTINVETGSITWTPTEDQLGTTGVSVRATDLAGNIADQTFGVTVTTGSGSTFEPADREQYMLELVNRMRMNPAEEIDLLLDSGDVNVAAALLAFGVDIDVLRTQWEDLTAAPPVAWNESLYNAAVKHSELMRDLDEQSHQLPGEVPLGQRVIAEGYDYTVVGENVYAFGQSIFHSHAAFAIDWGNEPNGIQDPPGHRITIMNTAFREIGIGIVDGISGNSTGPLIITQDYGNRADLGDSYLLGVVFTDADRDQAYDEGEGIGGAIVRAVGDTGTFTTTSMAAGGYQMQLPAGEYTVTFTGDAFSTAIVQTITVGADNVKLDTITPPAAPIAPDLVTAYDTGQSNTDDITSLAGVADGELQFIVSGVSVDAIVKLYAGGTLIGQATATAGTVLITAEGTAALADGTYDITAVQTLDALDSAASEVLTIVIDSTAPTFTGAPIDTGAAAQPYTYDAQTDEEGDVGHLYELVRRPKGMTIDIDTGIVIWNPAANQVGDHDVTIGATDLAGNTTEQAYVLSISDVATSGPDLFPTIADPQLFSTFVPGDRPRLTVSIRNLGDLKADGKITVKFYLSADATLDASDVQVAQVDDRRVRIRTGRSARISARFLVEDTLPVGTYYVIADVDTTDVIAEVNEGNNVAVSDAEHELVWAFGNVDGRQNVAMLVHDDAGALVRFTLRGAGRGDMTGGSSFTQLSLTGTDETTVVAVNPQGRGVITTLVDVVGDGSVWAFSAANVNLGGDFTLAGGIARLQLRDATAGSTVTLGSLADAAAQANVTLHDVADLSLTSEMLLGKVTVARWLDTDATPDTITAPAMTHLIVRGDRRVGIPGDSQVGLDLAGRAGVEFTIIQARISGDVLGGTWEITGTVKLITGASFAGDWSADIDGTLRKITAKENFAGTLDATIVESMRVGADLDGATITLTQGIDPELFALRRLTVAGWITDSVLRFAGNVKTIIARAARDSLIFAGVDADVTTLPDPATDFTTEAGIESIRFRGLRDEPFSFINTNIAAYALGRVSYVYAQTDNGGTQFGLAANSLRRLRYKDARGTFRWPNRNEPDGPADDGDRVTRLA